MADPNQFLRLQLGKVSYLLPSTAGFTIEQRESLVTNKSSEGNAIAWRNARGKRWPAYCLDSDLKLTRHQNWHRAVFLEAMPHAVGIVVDEVQLLPRAETTVSPFTPIGSPPTQQGHLFSGAWVTNNRVILVFEPKAFVAYLQTLEDAA